MLREYVLKYYNNGYNCAESVVRGGNEFYALGLTEREMKMSGAFGGGMQVGDVCGTITGAACVVSAKYIETKAHDLGDELKIFMEKLFLAFEEKLGSRHCRDMKPEPFDKEGERCTIVVRQAADIIEEVIQAYEAGSEI